MNKDYYKLGEELGELIASMICNYCYAAGLGDAMLGGEGDADQDAKNCEEFFNGFAKTITTEIPW